MRTKTEQPAVAFNATKDDDDLLEKKSVIFCWLTEITLSLHPGKATANRQTHHFSCGQKQSNLRSHSTRRKMMMIYLKKKECHLLLSKENQFIPSSRESNCKSANASFFMRTKTEQPAVAFNATKDDDDLLEKKSVIFCWLNEINLSLHPGKATANQQTHQFWCGQKLSNLRSHSTRRKMMMIYLKRRVSSFAD